MGLQRTVEQKVNNNSHWRKWNQLSVNSKTSSRKRKSWWKTCNFFNYAFPFYKFFQKKTTSSSFVVEVLVSIHLFFNIISRINLLSMDIDSFLALPHPKQNISICIGVEFTTYHRNYL